VPLKNAIRDIGISHYAQMAGQEFQNAAYEMQRPFILLKPKIFMDGGKWCALYGESLKEGVAGFGILLQKLLGILTNNGQKISTTNPYQFIREGGMSEDVECPYCEKSQEICHDDGFVMKNQRRMNKNVAIVKRLLCFIPALVFIIKDIKLIV